MAGRTDLRTIFERRAETVLRQARQLATLCATPACVVIYNPNASKPWRMWPESEAGVRSVVELYRERAESGWFGGGGDGLGEMTEEEAMGALVDVEWRMGEVQARIDMIISEGRNINNNDNNNNGHLMVPLAVVPQPAEEWAMVVAGAADWMNMENNNVVCQNASPGVNFDHHEEEEDFDIAEYLNASVLESVGNGGGDDLDRALIDHSGHCYFDDVFKNVVAPNDATQYVHQFVAKAVTNNNAEPLLYEQGTSSDSSGPRRVAGNKRKVPEKVASFSELMSPSSQLRRKLRKTQV